MPESRQKIKFTGMAAGVMAFLTWGLLPTYWKMLYMVPAFVILCHRIFWSFIFAGLILTLSRRWPEFTQSIHSQKSLFLLVLSSIFISINWLTYIWGVNAGFILDASMGYYINPLVNVFLGFVFFQDRLRILQILAIFLAALGVLNLVVNYGRFPWIALTLAFSFGLYGLIRKKVNVQPLPGFFIEMMFLSIPTSGYLILQHLEGAGALGQINLQVDILLLGAGIVTAMPLLLFTFSAKRLRLTDVGLLQYIAPTCMFLQGVFIYNEPFTYYHLISFVLIWTGLAIYMAEGIWHFKRMQPG